MHSRTNPLLVICLVILLLAAVVWLLDRAPAGAAEARGGGCRLLALTGRLSGVACNWLGRCAGTLTEGRAGGARYTVRGRNWIEGQTVTVPWRVCP